MSIPTYPACVPMALWNSSPSVGGATIGRSLGSWVWCGPAGPHRGYGWWCWAEPVWPLLRYVFLPHPTVGSLEAGTWPSLGCGLLLGHTSQHATQLPLGVLQLTREHTSCLLLTAAAKAVGSVAEQRRHRLLLPQAPWHCGALPGATVVFHKAHLDSASGGLERNRHML